MFILSFTNIILHALVLDGLLPQQMETNMTTKSMERGKALRLLRINSSARFEDSSSRALTDDVIGALEARYGEIEVTERDLAGGIRFVDENWVGANATATETRSDGQRETLAYSDELVAELQAADAIVIGVPVYNFSIPATLKAWIDMVARAGLTFRYTKDGPQGLLKDKKVYLAIASGGVPVDSPADFATPYLRHILKFIGISDVEVFAADQINRRGEEAIEDARLKIANAVHTAPSLQVVAA